MCVWGVSFVQLLVPSVCAASDKTAPPTLVLTPPHWLFPHSTHRCYAYPPPPPPPPPKVPYDGPPPPDCESNETKEGGCGDAMVLSAFAEGAYATGWACEECEKAGTGERWFCRTCQSDVCKECIE